MNSKRPQATADARAASFEAVLKELIQDFAVAEIERRLAIQQEAIDRQRAALERGEARVEKVVESMSVPSTSKEKPKKRKSASTLRVEQKEDSEVVVVVHSPEEEIEDTPTEISSEFDINAQHIPPDILEEEK